MLILSPFASKALDNTNMCNAALCLQEYSVPAWEFKKLSLYVLEGADENHEKPQAVRHALQD
jgi:hypothetical protein